jgi:imidazolonepropionase-like amidohydrolase
VPGNAQLLPEELEAATSEAHRHGLRVAAHAIGTEGIKNALRAGVDSIEHASLLDDEAIALFNERGAYLVPTLSAPACILDHMHDGSQPDWVVRKAESVGAVMTENVARAYRAGVRIAGGSDSGTPYNGHDAYAREIELMHRTLGMSAVEALHAATGASAELLGLHRGILAPGETADLVLWPRDLEHDIRVLREPQIVIKAGRTLVP